MASAVDRTALPILDPSLSVKLGKTIADTKPDWGILGGQKPPEGEPNVLLILIDDAGSGNSSTFGAPIDTPNYTRMAEGGIRYNRSARWRSARLPGLRW